MRLWLSKLPENLGWEDVINAMMAAHGERGGKHARTALENMLSSSDEDMLNKIADAIEHIGQRVCFTMASSIGGSRGPAPPPPLILGKKIRND